MTREPATGDAWHRLLPWLLALIGVFVYVGSLEGPFVFDDERHIDRIAAIEGPGGLVSALAADRRPLVTLSLALNHAIGGSQVVGYHAFNIAVHLLAALVLYGLARRLIERHDGAEARWLAFAVALLWLVHPLVTQAVNYTIQRSELMAGLFLLCAMYATVRSADGGRSRTWQAAAVAAGLLGMLSKEVAVVVPLLVLVLDRTLLAGSFITAIRRRPWLYAGLLGTWLLMLIMLRGGAVLAAPASAGFRVPDVTVGAYVLTQCAVLCHYLRLAVWPHPLVFDYNWPLAQGVGEVWPYGLLIAGLLAATIVGLFRRHWLGAAGAWFFLTLAPTSSLMPIVDAAVEHRMYVPLIAVMAVIVLGGRGLLGRPGDRAARSRVAVGLLVAAALVLAMLTIRRHADYHTAATLWQSVVDRVGRQNPRAYQSLGLALEREERLEEAAKAYDVSIACTPESADAWHGRGAVRLKLGDLDGAVADFDRTLELEAERPTTHFNLGHVRLRQGRTDEAGASFEKAIALQPDYAAAFNMLGKVRLDQDRPEDAIAAITGFLRLAPRSAEGHLNLGHACFRAGRIEQGLRAYRAAVALRPGNPVFILKLALALDEAGKPAEAIDRYRAVLRGDRGAAYHAALCRLALLRAAAADPQMRDTTEALRLAREANAIVATVESRDALAAALADAGRYEEAVTMAERALDLAADRGAGESVIEPLEARLSLYRDGRPYRRP